MAQVQVGATGNFSDETVLGKGEFGKVYRSGISKPSQPLRCTCTGAGKTCHRCASDYYCAVHTVDCTVLYTALYTILSIVLYKVLLRTPAYCAQYCTQHYCGLLNTVHSTVYRVEHPDGSGLAVMRLEVGSSRRSFRREMEHLRPLEPTQGACDHLSPGALAPCACLILVHCPAVYCTQSGAPGWVIAGSDKGAGAQEFDGITGL